jgi:hypothetical protein
MIRKVCKRDTEKLRARRKPGVEPVNMPNAISEMSVDYCTSIVKIRSEPILRLSDSNT